jgi:hypothetical protein
MWNPFNHRRTELLKQIESLEKKVRALERDLEDALVRRFSVIDTLDESIPDGATERRAYMTDVTNFYVRIFRKKLPHFISLQLHELSKIGQPERMYDTYRANINVLYLIDEWMHKCEVEYLGDLESQRDDVTEALNLVDAMKREYITEN